MAALRRARFSINTSPKWNAMSFVIFDTMCPTAKSGRAKLNRFLTRLIAIAILPLQVHGAEVRRENVTQLTQTFRNIPRQSAEVIEDLGDIRPLADRSFFRRLRFTSSLYGEFVSNALSIGDHSSGDFVLMPSVSAAFDESLGHGLSIAGTARTEAFLYSNFDEQSFWGFSGAAMARYQPTKEWPRIFAGIEAYSYASVRTGSQISDALAVTAGIEKEWAFNRDQTVLFIAYSFSNFFSSPPVDNRLLHRATLGITQQIVPSLYGQLFYSYQFSDYTNLDRQDSRNFVGANLVYQFKDHWFARVSTYLVDSHSSRSAFSYQTFGVGLGAGYNF